VVTPLAVNTSHFRPDLSWKVGAVMERYGLSGQYILCVASGDRRKNLPLLIDVWQKLSKKIPHQLIIAGKSGLDTPLIRERIKRYGLTGRVMLLDYVAYDDLPVLMGGADVFVWPSVYEGWGLPPLEALACGTPVVASNGGAIQESVGKAGLIVPFREENLNERRHDQEFKDEMVDVIERIVADERLRGKMKVAGLERVKELNWDKVAAKTEEVYQGLV
jgi:glycosyltransferase involved in cell wall biosynthesis